MYVFLSARVRAGFVFLSLVFSFPLAAAIIFLGSQFDATIVPVWYSRGIERFDETVTQAFRRLDVSLGRPFFVYGFTVAVH